MPKKSKSTENASEPTKPARRRSTSTKKKSAGGKTLATKRKTAKGSPATAPTDEEIRLRAYFVSERRHRLGLGGDASSDWLEAKRQLLSEFGPR